MKDRQEVVAHRGSVPGSWMAWAQRSLLFQQWKARRNECKMWTTWCAGPKVSQVELCHLRNQYLSVVIFHLTVHYFSEFCTTTALRLVITERYKQLHKENYSHEISDLIMQTQDKVKILMKFLSVLTFFKYNIAEPGLGRECSDTGKAAHSYNRAVIPDLGQLSSAMYLIRMIQEIA